MKFTSLSLNEIKVSEIKISPVPSPNLMERSAGVPIFRHFFKIVTRPVVSPSRFSYRYTSNHIWSLLNQNIFYSMTLDIRILIRGVESGTMSRDKCAHYSLLRTLSLEKEGQVYVCQVTAWSKASGCGKLFDCFWRVVCEFVGMYIVPWILRKLSSSQRRHCHHRNYTYIPTKGVQNWALFLSKILKHMSFLVLIQYM